MKEFVSLIDSFLENKVDYNQFYSQFNELYFGEGSADRNKKLESQQADFLDEINEKMFFAAKDPSEEERKYKYIDEKEFFSWLQSQKSQNIKFWG